MVIAGIVARCTDWLRREYRSRFGLAGGLGGVGTLGSSLAATFILDGLGDCEYLRVLGRPSGVGIWIQAKVVAHVGELISITFGHGFARAFDPLFVAQLVLGHSFFVPFTFPIVFVFVFANGIGIGIGLAETSIL